MLSTQTKSFSFVFNVQTGGARIHCAVFAAVLAGVLTCVTEARAQMQCDQGWEYRGGDEATLTLWPGANVTRDGINYMEYTLSDLPKGHTLMIDVGSRDFRPHLGLYRRDTDVYGRETRTAVMSLSGNPAVIRHQLQEQGNYVVIVSTSSPGESGRYSWAHVLCEQVAGSEGGRETGPACTPAWRAGKDNYRGPVGEPIYWKRYQDECSLGGCIYAGSDNQGHTWSTGFRTYSTESYMVETWAQRWDPRRGVTDYCPRP